MNICGIVAEYNPFHAGHAYHIEQTRLQLGEETAIVCAMSGNFVQRGEVAILSKNARAAAAVGGGADLVLELPLPWAISSAERFARGAVELLAATGVVTHLSFGSESGDIAALGEAEALLRRPEFGELLTAELSSGVSFAAARQAAAEKLAGDCAGMFSAPNNILAIEYLKAIVAGNLPLQPVTVARAGAGHDSADADAMPSASYLRARLAAGEGIEAILPEASADMLRCECAAGRAPVLAEHLETAMLSRLRMLPKSAFSSLPDAGEGLDNRLYKAVHSECSVQGILEAAKSKRYAMSRLRRMLIAAVLGVTAADSEGAPPYLRILAANERGLAVLREMRGCSTLPVITKPAEIHALDARARHIFDLETAATDFYVLGFPDALQRRPELDWQLSPYIKK